VALVPAAPPAALGAEIVGMLEAMTVMATIVEPDLLSPASVRETESESAPV